MATPIPRNTCSASILNAVRGARRLSAVRDASTLPLEISVVIDSRMVRHGDVFVAISGERVDGHDYVGAACASGASMVIVGREVAVPPGVDVMIVPDTLVALGQLAEGQLRVLRRRALTRLLGVTGSVGKTSTKEMCAAVLQAIGGSGARVERTPGNLNNLIGVPMTLLALPAVTTAAVNEMGMSVPGEIARLAAIAKPDVGVITSVAEVHTEGLGSLEGVAREKAALLAALTEDGIAIYPADDAVVRPHVEAIRARRRVGFGTASDAAVRLVSRTPGATGSARCTYLIAGRGVPAVIDLHLLGAGMALNAGAALALAWSLGGEAAIEPACRALSALRPGEGRGLVRPGVGGSLVIDDAYNASPRSMLNALSAAAELAAERGGRVIAVLGDMLELGDLSRRLHEDVGREAARTALFVACGPRMADAARAARAAGAPAVVALDDPEESIGIVGAAARAGDVIVVKGSRGMRMERVVAALGGAAPEKHGGGA